MIITAKELRERRMAKVDDILSEIETKILLADDADCRSVEYSVQGKSTDVLGELMHRLRTAGYRLTRNKRTGQPAVDTLIIQWD